VQLTERIVQGLVGQLDAVLQTLRRGDMAASNDLESSPAHLRLSFRKLVLTPPPHLTNGGFIISLCVVHGISKGR
jgi:hypothetical protein